LLDHIGDGGFGHVFSCIEVETSQLYAIKIIRAERVGEREVLHRFHREMRALKHIQHPNVIRLHEDNLETEADFPSFIMDLADITLHSYIGDTVPPGDGEDRRNLPIEEAATIFRSVLSAADALHSHNPAIAHRDINPSNILRLPNGVWVLADFSLAKFMTPTGVTSSFATQTKAAWGTGLYAAPEQYRDFRTSDARSDIYALGILIWDLFSSGWPPFERETPLLPTPLIRLFRKCTERLPSSRYATVAELASDFEAAMIDLLAQANTVETT
jgi:serine/threonine protein kinase